MSKFGEKEVNALITDKADGYLGTATKRDPNQRLVDEIKKRQVAEVPKV